MTHTRTNSRSSDCRITGLLLCAALLLLPGCATMDREQCAVADWRLIGYQDGVLGKSAATIGEYSRDCAEHAVVPDLDAWRAGRAEGLRQYCTEENGFRLGQAGRGHNAVCPEASEASFRAAYERGRAIYLARSRVSNTHSSLYRLQYEIDALEEDKRDKLSALVQKGVPGEQRMMLLYDIHEIEDEIRRLEGEIVELERDLAQQQAYLDRLTH